MARRVFFSFHYERDHWRANVVRNSWVTKDRESAGFFDAGELAWIVVQRPPPRFARITASGSFARRLGMPCERAPWVTSGPVFGGCSGWELGGPQVCVTRWLRARRLLTVSPPPRSRRSPTLREGAFQEQR